MTDSEKYNANFKIAEKMLNFTRIKEVMSILPKINGIDIYVTDINIKDKLLIYYGDIIFFKEMSEEELENVKINFIEVKQHNNCDYHIVNNALTEDIRKGLIFLSYTGSTCYNCKTDNSDVDIAGISIPPKEIVFPYFQKEIPGFTKQIKYFEQFEIKSNLCNNLEGPIYSIIKYFKLCLDNNPNMIDSLYINPKYYIYTDKLWNKILLNRDLFLSKKIYYKFLAYANSQYKKLHNVNREGKRKELVDCYGYDTKYASHLVRLVSELKQILQECVLDLDKNGSLLKDIKEGKWKLEEVEKYFEDGKKELEELYKTTKLQEKPDYDKIKDLLVNILEDFYDEQLFNFEKSYE